MESKKVFIVITKFVAFEKDFVFQLRASPTGPLDFLRRMPSAQLPTRII
jgi:hypothetical protein